MVSYVIEVEEIGPRVTTEAAALATAAAARSASGASSAPGAARAERRAVHISSNPPPPPSHPASQVDPSPELASLRMEVENLKRVAGIRGGLAVPSPSMQDAATALPPFAAMPTPLPKQHDEAWGVPPLFRTAATPSGLPAAPTPTRIPSAPTPTQSSAVQPQPRAVAYTPPEKRPSLAALGSLLPSAPPDVGDASPAKAEPIIPPSSFRATGRSPTPVAGAYPPPPQQQRVKDEMLRQQEKEIMSLEAENLALKRALEGEAKKRADMQGRLASLSDVEERLMACEEEYLAEKKAWRGVEQQLTERVEEMTRLLEATAREMELVKGTSARYQAEVTRLETEQEDTRERVGKYETDTAAWQAEVKAYVAGKEAEHGKEAERMQAELRAMFKTARDMENRAIRAEEELHVRRVLSPTPAGPPHAGADAPPAADEQEIKSPPCRKLPESSSHLVILQDDLTKAVHRLKRDVDSLHDRPKPATVHEALAMYRKANLTEPPAADASPAAQLAAIRAAAHQRILPPAPMAPPVDDASDEHGAQEAASFTGSQ
eukprot:TRINITY_DN2874_c0_g1_i1.p1 TRINITY_DN2874_c0_g1~~TRINITY_DN2874_c0_g1_i1.p1  ORF type:complete len:546 (+),score=178.58 TRINITY_DN2874_c0_g1_i1:33-1670(+)